jgi:hypothetical protein
MTLTFILPAIAAGLFVVNAIYLARSRTESGLHWHVPLVLSGAFLAFSLWTVAAEGPMGFWPNHTVNLWGNQVWIDLLLAITIGWTLILPRARAVHMNTGGWLAAIILSGSIAFLAMLGRLLFLEARADSTETNWQLKPER